MILHRKILDKTTVRRTRHMDWPNLPEGSVRRKISLQCECGMGVQRSEYAFGHHAVQFMHLGICRNIRIIPPCFVMHDRGIFQNEILAFNFMFQSRQIRMRIQTRILVSL